MPSRRMLDRLPAARGFAPIFLANLLPLIGVLRLGWNPETLVVIYTLEVFFSFPFAGAKALFAQRPPRTDRDDATVISVSNELTEKRGRIELVSWLPPIYPRNIPFAVTVFGAAAWFAILVGVALADTLPVADVLSRPIVVVSVVALVAGQWIETWRDYLRDTRFTDASPYTVIETPARQAFFLAFVLFIVSGPVAGGAALVVAVIVLGKLLVEWSAYRATHGGGGRVTGWLSGPDAATEDADSIHVPDREPDARITTNARAVVSTGLLSTLTKLAPFYASWSLIIWLVSLFVLGGEEPSRAVAIGSGLVILGLLVGVLAVEVAMYYLQYGPLVYRRYGDRLITYDVALNEPQWSASIEVLRDVVVVPDRLPDRLLGTRTIAVTTGWNEDESRRYLGPVAAADADTLVETLDLPVHTTDLAPLNRQLTVGVLVCGLAIGIAAVLSVFGPWRSPNVWFLGGFGLPFIALVLRVLWEQAYPDQDE